MIHYFISDAHLFPEGTPHPGRDALYRFLDGLSGTGPHCLWILGDLFDYWFEYRSVVPGGYSGVLGRLRTLTDSGWTASFIPGNHDWWVGRFFTEETGMKVLRKTPLRVDLDGLKAVIAHGDGLGRGDWGYRIVKPVLQAGISRSLFSMLHPSLATGLAMAASGTSRRYLRRTVRTIPSHLEAWAVEQLDGADLVVTGHTHVPRLARVRDGFMVSLGDWINSFTYLKVEEGKPRFERFNG